MHSFEKALAIDPDSLVSHINMANIYLSLGKIDKSIEHNTRATQIKPDFGMAHNNLAVALHQNGDDDGARKHAQEAINLGYPVPREFLTEIGLP